MINFCLKTELLSLILLPENLYINSASALCLKCWSANLQLTPPNNLFKNLKNLFSSLPPPICLQCEMKEEYIERIQTLDFDTKAAIASHIQEVNLLHSQQN